jgi:hypothetical protein
MTLQLTRGTSHTFESPPFEESPGGVAILPVDPSSYPQFSITDPEGTIIQQGVSKALNDRIYSTYFHVPVDAPLSYAGGVWRITWIMVSTNNRQIEASLDFEVVDNVEVNEDERAYTYLVRLDRPERLLFRTMQRPAELEVKLLDARGDTVFSANQVANQNVPAQPDEIQEVIDGSQYVYWIDLPVFTASGEYHAIWDWRETTISPLQTSMQVVRVVHKNVWKWFTPLRMMIDKLQKKQGRPQAYTDADIYEYLLRGVAFINAKYPSTSWTLASYPTICGVDSLLLAAAAVWGLRAQHIMAGELAFSYGGQTLSLDLDHTGTYSEAQSVWLQHIDDNARPAKLCVVRQGGNTSVGLRPYGINLATTSRPLRHGAVLSEGAVSLLGLLEL